MRTLLVPLLLFLLAVPSRAQEDVTAQLPQGAPGAIKVKSLDRVDAIVKDWVPMLKALGLGEQVKNLETMPASNWFFMESGISADMIDRTKPIYVGITDDDDVLAVFHPGAGAAWEGRKELASGEAAMRRGGAVVAGEAKMLDAPARGAPTLFRVDADLVIHVYLGELIAAEKENIEREAANAAMNIAAAGEIPEEARALVLPLVTALKNGVLSVESFDYGLTWTGERVECEGFLAIQEGSGLRNLLKRAGEPGSTDLVGYLPKDAFITVSGSMSPDWPVKEMKELLEKAGGGEVAQAILQLISAGAGFSDSLTGKSAAAVNINMMAGNIVTLYETKAGIDPKKVFDTFDAAKMTEAMKKIGLPIGYEFEKGVAKHGEVELHRFGMTSEDPMIAMSLASMQGCMAARDGLMIMAMSPTAQDDVKVVLDKVARGEKIADHPHAQAMARLGRGHNIGFTVNLGALKPMAMMFGMFGMPREVIQAIQNVPDTLTLSTAITFPDGNIRWRGDWPVKEVAKAAEAIMKSMPQGGDVPPEPPAQDGCEPEEEFD